MENHLFWGDFFYQNTSHVNYETLSRKNVNPLRDYFANFVKMPLSLQNMKETIKFAVWIDCASAHLMEYQSEPFEVKKIESKLRHEPWIDRMEEEEKSMDDIEPELSSPYYTKLVSTIKKYDSVVILGQNDAKSELFSLIKNDPKLSESKIEVVTADILTEKQLNAFVRNYSSAFSKKS